jgi:ribonuclease HIII
MPRVEFIYPLDKAQRFVEDFAEANCYPYERKRIDDGYMIKYFLTTGDKEETVLVMHYRGNGNSSSLTVEKGNDSIIKDILEFSLRENVSQARIGIDEAGKGDFFGPLVIGAVAVNPENEIELRSLGVMDSKKISDQDIAKIAGMIKKSFPHDTVVIGPERYNSLYNKFNNLNRFLAWGHARALENLLRRVDYKTAISDKFTSKNFLKRALMEKGKSVELVEIPRAEADVAVAAASILARAEFLSRLGKLSKSSGVKLPKGCSAEVIGAGKELVGRYGPGSLSKYAKLHFKTTERIINREA